MMRRLIVRRRAELYAQAARDWYDEQVPGLGDQLIGELDVAVRKAQENPLYFQKVNLEIRRVLLRRFP